MPEITVLMPVRNGERYIKESIDSVLNQTLTDFEFLIIDDGSTDRTVEIIQGYTDKRIRLVRKEHQFIQNLNEGLELASGSYIARMDADDIMEDYKLWFDIAKAGGILFVEPQELLMFRRSDTQVTVTKKKEMSLGSIRLRKEILLYLLSVYNNKTLNSLLSDFENLEKNKWMSNEDIFRFFVNLFNRIQRDTMV